MFKFILLSSALVLSASAIPAETTEQTGGLFRKIYNGNLLASQKTADLIKNSVSKATGLGSDTVDVVSHVGKAAADAGFGLGMKGVSEGISIASQMTELARDYTKHLPGIGKIVDAGTKLADMGLAAGLHGSVMALDTAKDITNKGINVASGVAQNTLGMADKSVSSGTNMFKKGLGLFSWN